MQLEAETAGELWQRVTKINDIKLVDVTVVVDILVDGIAALELIEAAAFLIAELHLQRITLGIGDDLTVGVQGNRIGLAGVDVCLQSSQAL